MRTLPLVTIVLTLVHCTHGRPAVTALRASPAASRVVQAPAVQAVAVRAPATAEGGRPALRGRVIPVVNHAGRRWAVLSTEPAPDAATGPLTLIERNESVVVSSPVRPEAVPTAFVDVAGAALVLRGAGGERCRVTLGGPSLLARIHPHFGMVNHWDGHDDEGLPTLPRASDETVAREAFAAYDDGRLLVAPLTGEGCSGALWGHAEAPGAVAFVRSVADPATRAQALAAQRRTAAWREIQGRYLQEGPEPDRPAPRGSKWDELHAPPVVTVWRPEGGGREFVTVRSLVPREGCGVFSGALWTVWERVDGRLVARSPRVDPDAVQDFDPDVAADTDGDGAPEFVSAEGVMSLGPGGYGQTLSLQIAEHDCPC